MWLATYKPPVTLPSVPVLIQVLSTHVYQFQLSGGLQFRVCVCVSFNLILRNYAALTGCDEAKEVSSIHTGWQAYAERRRTSLHLEPPLPRRARVGCSSVYGLAQFHLEHAGVLE